MSPDVSACGSVSQWLASAKQGDEGALGKLHERYWPALVGLARKRLHRSPVTSQDEDVAAQAFFGFYEAVKRGRVPELENRHQFLALLSHIIACKAYNQINHELTARRGGGRVQSSLPLAALVDNAVYSPLQEAILRECYEKYVGNIPANLREYAELFLEGFTRQEIAERLGCAQRTVDRKIAIVKEYWQSVAQQSITSDLSAL